MNTIIEDCINKLSNYFDEFEINPPASKKLIQNLDQFYPHLNNEIIEFYSYCNGFNVNLQQEYNKGIILSLDYIFETMEESRTGENPLFTILFPLRNDGFWNFDCMLMNNSIGDGSIVFWDNGTSPDPDHLLASSLEKYFTFLTDYLITRYHQNGQIKFEYDINNPKMLNYPWPYNYKWITNFHSKFAELENDNEFKKLFYTRKPM